MIPVSMYLLAGCYPDKIDFVDELDVSATVYDESADFNSYQTFTVIDTLIHLTEDGQDDPNLSRDYDDLILDLLRSNMSACGYTEIPDPDSLNRPDLVLFVEALSSENYYYYSYYYDYWSWYPGWDLWYPEYPWYPSYPWYPVYGNSYTTGTLIVEMADMERFDTEEGRLGFIWTGYVDGLLVNNSSQSANRLTTQINQLFIQSEYLKK